MPKALSDTILYFLVAGIIFFSFLLLLGVLSERLSVPVDYSRESQVEQLPGQRLEGEKKKGGQGGESESGEKQSNVLPIRWVNGGADAF